MGVGRSKCRGLRRGVCCGKHRAGASGGKFSFTRTSPNKGAHRHREGNRTLHKAQLQIISGSHEGIKQGVIGDTEALH